MRRSRGRSNTKGAPGLRSIHELSNPQVQAQGSSSNPMSKALIHAPSTSSNPTPMEQVQSSSSTPMETCTLSLNLWKNWNKERWWSKGEMKEWECLNRREKDSWNSKAANMKGWGNKWVMGTQKGVMTVGNASGINEETLPKRRSQTVSAEFKADSEIWLIRPVWTVDPTGRVKRKMTQSGRIRLVGLTDLNQLVRPGRSVIRPVGYRVKCPCINPTCRPDWSGSDWVSLTGLSDRSGQSDRSVRSVRPVQNAQWRLELKEWFWDLDKEHN